MSFLGLPVLLAGCFAALAPGVAGAPATEGIPWEFDADNPSAKALIGFRAPAREVEEVEKGFLWLEAEAFADYGGWWLDTQFVHLMGSACLIANGVSVPVEDASTKLNIPRDGTYRLWVRARNWLPEFSPGQFKVAVGGKRSEHTFGKAESDKWIWESGGEFELKQGPVAVALQDLSGEYARCDALLLTSDLKYTPPDEADALREERVRLAGLDITPKPAGEYDVIVVGAGAAGCAAAIASARLGAKTALIQNRPVLGGNASLELGVGICGAAVRHPNAREGGIIEEAGRIRTRFGHHRVSEAFRMLCEREKNLSVFLNEHVFDATMRDKKTIANVTSVNTLTGTITDYKGKLFIDCTGDGWVGFYAGADYRFGRESRDEFLEDLAPEKADEITMSGCIMGNITCSFRAEDTGEPNYYEAPAWAAKLPEKAAAKRRIRSVRSGNWWMEHPGTFNDLYDAERARDELIRITYGFWGFLKNRWEEKARAANYKLVYVPIVDARRETRRLMGDYILTQHDVLEARVFPDRISYGGWSLDIHHPEGIYSGEKGPFDFNPRVPLYTIPYRCIYSRNVENLLFAGRLASVTHVALGSVRVQGTLATLGQAAGTAATLCLKHDTDPRGIHKNHIGELQQTLLKHDQYIPKLQNEDPGDLARGAKVSASSTATAERFGKKNVSPHKETIHELVTPRATMFPVGDDPEIRGVNVLLRSKRQHPVEITLHLRGAKAAADYSSTNDLAVATATVPPGKERWISFPIGRKIDAPYAWVWLPPEKGIEWRLMMTAPAGSSRAYGGGNGRSWTVMENQYYACHTDPPRGLPISCPPESIVNGVSRIVDDNLNMWQSDPDKPMPQWIELDFGEEKTFNTVYITFDTNMDPRHKDLTGIEFVPQSVRDYAIAVPESDGWNVLAAETENFQRHRVHRFDPVTASRLRLTVKATNGDPSARVFEVRVYKE